MTTIYPLAAARAVALHAQGLTRPLDEDRLPSRDDMAAIARQIGALQIDTLQMVHRSHYLTLWSRLGSYDPAGFDALMYAPQAERRFFEYWLKAACFVPIEEYRYRLPLMRRYRENPRKGYREWLAKAEHREVMQRVRARIDQEGGLRTSDFSSDGHVRGTWWSWKPAKAALEYLYNCGELMIAERVNFQRVYEKSERVLPEWVDTSEPTEDEKNRYYVERAARAFGVAQPAQLADMARDIPRKSARAQVAALIGEGVLAEVQVELSDGAAQTLVIHRDALPLLQRAADGDLTAGRTTFLNFFDNLLWPQGRDRQFWDFRHILEAYKPAAQRIWGYYCLSILHRDRLVGRFDPKLERKTGTLRLKALYLEPGVAPDEELIAGVAAAMRDFLHFHEATELVIERSEPDEFSAKLLAAL